MQSRLSKAKTFFSESWVYFASAIILALGALTIVVIFQPPPQPSNYNFSQTLLMVIAIGLSLSWVMHGPGFWLFRIN